LHNYFWFPESKKLELVRRQTLFGGRMSHVLF
jgi:hypothetical protein